MEDKKINIVEAGVVVCALLLTELFEMAITFLLPAVGELIKWMTNIVIWIPIQFWLRIKGMRQDYYAAASLVEFIPFLNALPIKTAALLITIYIHNKVR